MKDSLNVKRKFSELRGELTLLQFWASWCGYCKLDNNDLKEAIDLFSNDGFKIVGVSIDEDKSKWKKAITNHSLNWENLISSNGINGEVIKTYGIMSIPNNFLFDSNGILIAKSIKGENLVQEIEDYFNNK